jgi:hypothetical protein
MSVARGSIEPSHQEHADAASASPGQREATLWQDDGWTARVIKNEDDDGWAVEMTRDGELEPALVGPWTMGRDKKNPKPLDTHAFAVLVKAANEVRARHLQQLHAQLHRSVEVESADERVRVDLDIKPDEDDPHAILTAHLASGAVRSRVEANFKLTQESARRWLASEVGS